jgi:hypothetical protein
MDYIANVQGSASLVLFLLAITAMFFAASGLLIGAIFTFGKIGNLEAKIVSLECIVANQRHVIDCLKSALEGALDYISKNSSADSVLAKNWALALEMEAANLPHLVDE